MKAFINNILSKISLSILSNSNYSTPRIQSYIILVPILLMIATFLVIEIWQFIHCINIGKDYYISSEIMVIFGMTLSHHLALIFSRKSTQSISDISGDKKSKKSKELPSSDEPVQD